MVYLYETGIRSPAESLTGRGPIDIPLSSGTVLLFFWWTASVPSRSLQYNRDWCEAVAWGRWASAMVISLGVSAWPQGGQYIYLQQDIRFHAEACRELPSLSVLTWSHSIWKGVKENKEVTSFWHFYKYNIFITFVRFIYAYNGFSSCSSLSPPPNSSLLLTFMQLSLCL